MRDIIFSDDHIIIWADYQTPHEHCHFAKQLIFGIDEEIICKVDDSLVHGKGICIASNVSHTAKTACTLYTACQNYHILITVFID